MAALCVGCSFSADKKEAEGLAEQYFADIRGSDFEGALALYSPRFFAVTSREQWLLFLKEQRSRCGTPKTHTLTNWNVFSSFGINSGTRTTLTYEVEYSSCRVSESLTTFKPSGGKIQIQGHYFNSNPKPGTQGESQATLKT